MIQIDILTLFPEMMGNALSYSIVKLAKENKLVDFNIIDIRNFSTHKHKKVDDYPYGGGGGMVMTAEPLDLALEHLSSQKKIDHIIFLTPDAPLYTQKDANSLSVKNNLVFICGHYKGIDQRIRDKWNTLEYSIGDYVVTGGELPTLLVIDSIVRLIPHAVGNSESILKDSHQEGLLSAPIYTRPFDYKGMQVPKILISGDQSKIQEWEQKQSLDKTKNIRPDLLHIKK